MLPLCALLSLTAVAPGEEPALVTVLVARQAVPSGTRLDEPEKYFKAVRYAEGDQPPDALTRFDQIRGKVVVRRLAADQPVKRDDLADRPAANVLPEGHRAVAIKVPADLGAGFLMPGSRVDVVAVTRQGNDAVARVVAEDLLVLAVDMTVPRNAERPEALVVTLAAKTETAQRLALAAQAGELRLILKAPRDR